MEADGNGRGKSRKITETALQVLVTTEQPSRYEPKWTPRTEQTPKNQAKMQNTKTENQNPSNKAIAL